MNPYRVMQNSFSGGEFSPVLNARQDMQKYGTGLSLMKNFYVKPQGSVINRPGTHFIAEVKDSTKKVKLFSFVFSNSVSYALEFGDCYIRFYRNGVQIVDSENNPYEVTTTYTEDEVFKLQMAQSADVLFIAHPSHKPMKLSRYSDTSWTFDEFSFKLGPFAPMDTSNTVIYPSGQTGTITLTATFPIFTANHVGSLMKLKGFVAAQTLSTSMSSSGISSTIKGEGTWLLTTHGTWAGSITIEKSDDEGASWHTIRTFSANSEYNVDTSGVEQDEIVLLRANIIITSGEIHFDLQFEPFTNDGIVLITGYTSSTQVTALVKQDVMGTSQSTVNGQTSGVAANGGATIVITGTFTGNVYVELSDSGTWNTVATYTASGTYTIGPGHGAYRVRYQITSGSIAATITGYDASASTSGNCTNTGIIYWYWGAWNAVRGYPCAVVFFQNRLCFGYTESEPQTIWSSQTGDYVNFGTSYVSADSDSITTPCVSEQVNAIKSMKALSKIIAFTAGGYWLIGSGGSSDAFTPDSETASLEERFGAGDITPLIIGNRILFTGSKNNVIRDVGYDITSESYNANDLTLYSSHLFLSHTVEDWAYCQDPDSIVYAVRDDGIILAMAYLKEQQVCAWSRIVTDGKFESVCSVPNDTRDCLYAVVNRTINGVTKRYIEMFADRTTTGADATNSRGETYVKYDPSDQYFVDCGVSYNLSTAATIFTGLSHLEGKTVSILADGNVEPQQVVSGGKITLSKSAKIVHIGLPFSCDLETLAVDFQSQQGTIQGMKKNIKRIILRVDNTRGILVGGDFNKMYEVKMRSNEPYGESISLYTGDFNFTIPSGSTIDGKICLRITDPLPAEILAIISEVVLDG